MDYRRKLYARDKGKRMQIKKWSDTFAYDETSKRKLEFPMKYDAKNPAFIRSDVLRIVLFKVMHTKCKSKR